jgi:hypothetical protein
MRCNRQRRRLMSALTCLSVTVIFVGCSGESATGPPRMHVSGQVTYDGKPIPDGNIRFNPIDGTSGESPMVQIQEGKYDVPASMGLVVKGRYNVVITAERPTGKTMHNPFAYKMKDLPLVQELENYIPTKYNSQTNLSVTVSEDDSKNKFDFALEPGALPKKKGSRR